MKKLLLILLVLSFYSSFGQRYLIGVSTTDPVYSAEATDVFNQMSDPLSSTYKSAISKFIDSQVSAGQYTKILEFWLFANNTSANSLQGFKGVSDATLTGSPTFSSSYGYLLNGTTQYINSNFIPSVNAVGHESSFAVGAFLKENLTTSNDVALFGCSPTGAAGHIGLRQTPSSGAIRVYANTNTFLDVSEGSGDDKILDSETQYTSVQNAGTAYLYKDGLNILSSARANTGLSTVNLLFGAHLSNVTVVSYLNGKISCGYVIDPTNFDFRAFHLALRLMLQTLGVYNADPDLTIQAGGEWFDFSQSTVGTFSSLIGRKASLTALPVNSPSIEDVDGVNMARVESANSEAINTASVFQAMYDHSTLGFSILMTLKPIDGTPSSTQAILGHTNSANTQNVSINTSGIPVVTFKEAVQSSVNTTPDYAAFNNSPTATTIVLIEYFKDNMKVFVNGIAVNETIGSWGTRAVTDFDGGSRNLYLGASNVDGTVTNPFDGYIGDFMIRSGKWSQSQKERLMNYFANKFSIPVIDLYETDGQSNMMGEGDIATTLPAPYQGAQTGVYIYYKTDRTSTDNGSWQNLNSGVNNVDPFYIGSGFFGIDSKFGKDLHDNLGKTVYIVKSALGGTSIGQHFNGQSEGTTTNDYYMKPSCSKLAKDGFVKFKASLWFQGFADCQSLSSANAYASNLTILAADKRSTWASIFINDVEFNMVVLESPDFTDAPTTPTWVDIVQAAQLAFQSQGRKNYSIAKPLGVTFNGGGGTHVDGPSLLNYSDKTYLVIKDF